MNNIIINVDDFGISRAYNFGIIDAFTSGSISSTTLLITSKHVLHAVELMEQNPKLGVGLHLAITSFPSLSNSKDVSYNGKLLQQSTYFSDSKKLNVEEIYDEFKLQIELFIKIVGKLPTHLDVHHHMHRIPEIKQIVVKLADEYNLYARNVNVKRGRSVVNIDFYGENVTKSGLKIAIKNLRDKKGFDNYELCVHSGYIDQQLINDSSYNLMRLKELELLMDPEFSKYLEDEKICLVPYMN